MKPQKPIGGSYEDWVAYYNATVDYDEWALDPGERLIFDPDHGIVAYGIDPRFDAIVVGRGAGDGKWIEETVTEVCKKVGMKKVILLTYRNPETFIRKFGMKVHAVFLEKEV